MNISFKIADISRILERLDDSRAIKSSKARKFGVKASKNRLGQDKNFKDEYCFNR